MMEKAELIPEWKVREACAQCMKNEKHARYFNNAPAGAKQYIALVFFETVYPNDLTEEVSNQCFSEMLHELNADDLRYLITHETDPRTRDVFVERLAFLREDSVLQRRRAEKSKTSVAERPAVARTASSAEPRPSEPEAVPVYRFTYNVGRLDREVAAWKRRWITVCVSLALIVIVLIVCVVGWFAISKGLIRVRRW